MCLTSELEKGCIVSLQQEGKEEEEEERLAAEKKIKKTKWD